MHIEILTEDQSTKALLDTIVPRFVGDDSNHTWRIISYRGIGRIPKDLRGKSDPSKRIILDQLPRVIRGYANTPGIDAVLVVIDTDTRPCNIFLQELKALVAELKVNIGVKFRLAIEETEAWYFGDAFAVKKAYPKAKEDVLSKYQQDSICGTWELMADAVYPGGSTAVKRAGWPLPGQLKCEWSKNIAPHMDIEKNASPSFNKLKQFFDILEN